MDNASDALIFAGTMLIALIIITIGVYLAASHSQVAESYDSSMQTKEIEAFNTRFEAFRGRSDITPQEIYTLVQFCKQYKDETGIEVKINGVNINNLEELKNKANESVLDVNNKKVQYKAYKCENNDTSIKYDDETGRVKEITFSSINITKNYSDTD